MRISLCLQLQEASPRAAPASWNEWHPHCPTWHECCHARVRVLARLDRRAAQSVPLSKRASARRALLEA